MNAGVILFVVFAICIMIGAPISISLGIGSLAAVLSETSAFLPRPSPSVFSAACSPPPSWRSPSLSSRAT